MPRKVLFNGSVLFRPGAFTRIDASQFTSLALSGVGAVGLIGEADGGQPSVLKTFTDPASVKTFYRSGPLVEAANLLGAPSKDPRIPGGATLIATVKVNQSTQASFQSTISGSNAILFQSVSYGDSTNLLSVAFATGPTTGRMLTVRDKSSATAVTEISPELGATGKLVIQYTGAGASALLTITPTTLTITTGVAADDISINFGAVTNLKDVISTIAAKSVYTITTLIASADSFNPANLDYVNATNVKVAPTTLYSRNFDVTDWVNSNSQLILATRSAGAFPIGASWPDTFVETALTGGTRGTSSNTTWVNSLALLGTINVQQVIPLASRDGSVFGLGDTYTFASIAAATEAHARALSGTLGRSERQAWIGGALSKSALISQAIALNSEHACLSGQQAQFLRLDGSISYGEEYFFAVLLAGMRAGAPLGEPLTWKFPNCISVKTRDGSWDPDNDTDSADLINNGIIYARNVPQKGVRIERGLTTFLKFENDAFTEESIVQGWKNISRELRAGLEDKFVGTRGLLRNVSNVIPTAFSILEKLRDEGQITDSVVNGTVTPGFGNFKLTFSNGVLRYSVEVSPVPGINWILNDLFLVPTTINL